MTPVDIHAEVREQHEAEPLEHVQLVRGLRVQLRVVRVVRMVRGVEAAEGRDGVQGEVEEEEEATSSRTSRRLLDAWGGSARRVWGGEERAVLCRVGMRNMRWCLLGVVVPGEERGRRRILIVVRLGRSGVM